MNKELQEDQHTIEKNQKEINRLKAENDIKQDYCAKFSEMDAPDAPMCKYVTERAQLFQKVEADETPSDERRKAYTKLE